jgi:hypothetical protein
VIELPDVEEEAFEGFLKFIYTDKVKLTDQNVMSILYTGFALCSFLIKLNISGPFGQMIILLM